MAELCQHNQIIIDSGNSWCDDCGAATGVIYKPEIFLEDEENL